jgi:uncharacterized SAM-binding protein YcdF (DUF218 family)
MFYFLSKLLPLFVYPLGLACVLLALALCLRRRPRWQTGFVAVALALLWIGGNRIVSMALLRSLESQYPPDATLQSSPGPHADVIVVLGGGTCAPAAPRLTSEVNESGDRVLYAAQLYRQGAAAHILLSGGTTEWVGASSVPGAENMADILTTIGVPREALWLESTSRNTYENAVETQAILERRGATRVILVTSAWHMPRAYAVFAQTGLEVIPASTDVLVTQEDWEYYTQPDAVVQLFNLLPTASNLSFTTRALKEYIGLCIYGLRGWL